MHHMDEPGPAKRPRSSVREDEDAVAGDDGLATIEGCMLDEVQEEDEALETELRLRQAEIDDVRPPEPVSSFVCLRTTSWGACSMLTKGRHFMQVFM